MTIKEITRQQGITLTDLARKIGYSREHLTNVANGAPAGTALMKKLIRWSKGHLTVDDFNSDRLTADDFNSRVAPKTWSIKNVLKFKGMTLTDLAKQLGYSRVHITNVANGAPAGMKLARKLIRWSNDLIKIDDLINPDP